MLETGTGIGIKIFVLGISNTRLRSQAAAGGSVFAASVARQSVVPRPLDGAKRKLGGCLVRVALPLPRATDARFAYAL